MESTNRTGIAVSVSLAALFLAVAWHTETNRQEALPSASTPAAMASTELAPSPPIAAAEPQQRSLSTLDVDGTANCAEGHFCHFTCFEGGCAATCEAGSTCIATCFGGSCTQVCREGAVCSFSCEGGGCQRGCGEGAACSSSCEGGNCNVAGR